MAYVNKTTQHKQQTAERQQIAKRATIMSIVALVAMIITVLYELFVSCSCLEYANHGNSNSFEGLVIIFYYFPLMFALPVFILIDFLVIYGGRGIKYLSKPGKALKRYFAYFWSQILLFIPVLTIIIISATKTTFVATPDAYRVVAISALIFIVISVITLFVKIKDAKKIQAFLKYFNAIFLTLAVIETLGWIFCGLMNGLA